MKSKESNKSINTFFLMVSALIRLLYIAYIFYVFVQHFSTGIEKGLHLGIGQVGFYLSLVLAVTILCLLVPGFIPLDKLLNPGSKLKKLIYFDIWVFGISALTLCIGGVEQYRENVTQREVGPQVAIDCIYDEALQRNIKFGAKVFRQNFEKCLKGKNVSLKYIGQPIAEVLQNLPVNPADYVGEWTVNMKGCDYRVSLATNGYYHFAPNKCINPEQGLNKGIWAVFNDEMVWIPAHGTPNQIDFDKIVSDESHYFILVGSDGTPLKYSRVVNSPLSTSNENKGSSVAQYKASIIHRVDNNLPDIPDGKPIQISGSTEVIWQDLRDGRIMSWNPVSGEFIYLPIDPVELDVELDAISTEDGLLLFLTRMNKYNSPARTDVLLVREQGIILKTTLHLPRFDSKLLALPGQSVLVAAGVDSVTQLDSGPKKGHTEEVEIVSWRNGLLKSTKVGYLPRQSDCSLVVLNDGRVMLLGGSPLVRNIPRDDLQTYFFNVEDNYWEGGPEMLNPRTGHTATVLPDGSVLVAGGWTPADASMGVASRTTERWNPETNSFEAGDLLPKGLGNHSELSLMLHDQNSLLLFGGRQSRKEQNKSIFVFNVGDSVWRTALGECSPGYTSRVSALPFGYKGKSLMWCESNDFGTGPWSLVSLATETGQ